MQEGNVPQTKGSIQANVTGQTACLKALGIDFVFQIEGASAQSAYNSSSMTDDRINTLAAFTGSTHDAIVSAFEALTSSASFPPGNLIATLLETSDIFGAYAARALLWTFAALLPQPALPPVALFQPQADYWFQYWHGGVATDTCLIW